MRVLQLRNVALETVRQMRYQEDQGQDLFFTLVSSLIEVSEFEVTKVTTHTASHLGSLASKKTHG